MENSFLHSYERGLVKMRAAINENINKMATDEKEK